MYQNFRLLQEDPNSVFYVSKSGQAGGNGDGYFGSRRNPLPGVAELMAATPGGSTGVVGTGDYHWATSFANGSYGATAHDMLADGYVRVLGDGRTRFAPFANSGVRFTGFTFEQFGGFNFRAYYYGNPVYYTQCVFKVLPEFAGQPNSSAASIATFTDCVFVNVNFTACPAMDFTRCLFFNCTGAGLGSLTQCYLDATSALAANAATGCNVDPGADPAAGYGLSVAGAGPARTSPQGLSAEPRFNALAYDDFSVQAGSPHLLADIGPAQYRQGSTFVLQGPGPGQAATPASTSFAALDGSPAVGVREVAGSLVGTTQGQLGGHEQGGLLIEAASGTSGRASLLTERVRHSGGSPRTISRMQVLGGYNFDTTDPATEAELNPNSPQVFNNNVPTLGQYAAGEAGRNPNRLSYGLRWSVVPNPDPAVAADWVNGEAFVEMEWNTQPLYNPATLVGNGRPDFDPAQARAVVCTWYQLRLGLSNTYYH